MTDIEKIDKTPIGDLMEIYGYNGYHCNSCGQYWGN